MKSFVRLAFCAFLGLFGSITVWAQANTSYTINDGRLVYMLPTNMPAVCATTDYHKNYGFNLGGGWVDSSSGWAEILSQGSMTFCAPNGDTLVLRDIHVESFGPRMFSTAHVFYTPAFGANAGIKQDDGRIRIFDVLRTETDSMPTPGSASGSAEQVFFIWLNTDFQAGYTEFFPYPVLPKDTYGHLVVTYDVTADDPAVAAKK